jgi:stage II sporulation protein AA (anti-sigma F factor antagonist)
MKIKFSNRGINLIVSIESELDHHWAEYAKNKIDSELLKSNNRNLIFDFSKVSFMDSAGIGIIMGRYKNVKALKGNTALINVSPRISKIFEMSGVFQYVELYKNLDEAIKMLMAE